MSKFLNHKVLPHKSYPVIPYPVLFQLNILIVRIVFFYTEFTLTRDELFYSITLGLDNGHPPQSKELVRRPPQLLQHFRLQGEFTSAQWRCMS
jgi:hypothetical protein